MSRLPPKHYDSHDKEHAHYKKWKERVGEEVEVVCWYGGQHTNKQVVVLHLYIGEEYYRNHQHIQLPKPVKYMPEITPGCRIKFLGVFREVVIKRMLDPTVRIELLEILEVTPPKKDEDKSG